MSTSQLVQAEVAAQLRELLASVPPPGAPVIIVAWFLLRKAEVMDAIAVTNPAIFFHAKEMATRARYQARALTGDSSAI